MTARDGDGEGRPPAAGLTPDQAAYALRMIARFLRRDLRPFQRRCARPALLAAMRTAEPADRAVIASAAHFLMELKRTAGGRP